MIEKIIEFCCHRKLLTILMVAAFTYAGWMGLKRVKIDAIPDLSDTQVIVHSQWNVSPDLIEDQVTYPIVSNLLAVPKVKDIRGLSTFGNSYVYVIFEEGTDMYWARSRVMEYLANITSDLPDEVETRLGPDATGIGWIYQYALKDTSKNHSLHELRSFQDWFLRYQLQSVPGVAEIASFGGYQKQYQVHVDPYLLRTHNISLSNVAKAVREGNNESGARVVEFSGTDFMVRLRGYAETKEDIENIVIDSNKNGVPIFVKNVANVSLGPEIRRGVGDLNGQGDTVGGIVVMRHGENAAAVIGRVKEKLDELKSSFPEGVELVPTYDRSNLIKSAIETLKSKTLIEMLVVAAIILIFLMHFSSSLVPIIVLPVGVILSFLPMYFMGITANIMSLGGIIISIGAMVDAAIVVVENCHKKIEKWKTGQQSSTRFEVVKEALKEVGPPSFYSLLVIAISFLPIFALEAQEGRLFKPLAYAKTLTMFSAALLSITLVPALLVLLTNVPTLRFRPSWLSGFFNKLFTQDAYPENQHPISRSLIRLYDPCVEFVIRHRWKTVGAALFLFLVTIPIYWKLGSEFMPPLNEGTILYMPTTMPGISANEAQQLLQKQDKILKSFPEVKTVHGKAGHANTATDPAPLTMMETVIQLKDPSKWRTRERWYSFLPDFLKSPFQIFVPEHLTWDELIKKMDAKMQFPGLTNSWTMPIKARIDMLTTGIRTPVGIKIAGKDLESIVNIGESLENSLRSLEGTRSVFAERITGSYFLDFTWNRPALARHGITIEEAQQDVRTALGGRKVTEVIQGQERYSVQVRYARAFRQNPEDFKNILIDSPKGYQVPFGSVGTVEKVKGPGKIRNDNGLLTGYVFIDLNTSDIGSYVERAKQKIAKDIELPQGYSLTWSGQYKSLQRVQEKLSLILPITFILVLVLIYLNTRSVTKSFIVLLSAPFSAIGAVWLLYILGYNMSIGVWVGIIALLGIAAETAIYMLLYLDLSYQERQQSGHLQSFSDLEEAIHNGAVQRIRPKVMAVMTTFLGLLPVLMASSSATGADVMKRMVAPMVGGIFTSFLLELFVFPAIFAIWRMRTLRTSNPAISSGPPH